MPSRGVAYVAFGPNARRECAASISSLAAHVPDALVSVVTHERLVRPETGPWPHVATIFKADEPTDPGARLHKLSVDCWSGFDTTIYLDADTRVRGDITPLWDLADRWPIVITTSTRQGDDALGNCPADDRTATFDLYTTGHLVGLQCGMIAFQTHHPRVRLLFQAWREEWARFRDRDQAAFLRALHRVPVPVWLVGRDFNDGALVQHRYGAAERTRRPRL